MFKLIGNSLIIGSIELIGESMVLAEKSGVGAEHVRFQQTALVHRSRRS